jgi:hypothetical protein
MTATRHAAVSAESIQSRLHFIGQIIASTRASIYRRRHVDLAMIPDDQVSSSIAIRFDLHLPVWWLAVIAGSADIESFMTFVNYSCRRKTQNSKGY